MKEKELIELLQNMNPEGEIWVGTYNYERIPTASSFAFLMIAANISSIFNFFTSSITLIVGQEVYQQI